MTRNEQIKTMYKTEERIFKRFQRYWKAHEHTKNRDVKDLMQQRLDETNQDLKRIEKQIMKTMEIFK